MTSRLPSAMQRSRGMRDLLPTEMRAFRRVEDAFRAAATRWGYEEVRTPTIETYSLFTASGALTPQMLSGVYSFLDWDGWSGERVVLRPDSTIPVARAAAEGGMPLPARLSYIQNVFRFRESAEDREEWQAGLEYLGAPAAVGDLEVATVGCDALSALALTPVVRLSHVGIARAVIERAAPLDSPRGRDLLDEVAVAGLGAARAALNGDSRASAFLDVALRPAAGPALLANLAALAADAVPAALPPISELSDVAAALDASGRMVEVDLTMVRDFEYYTGVVFEFAANGETWGGGGRYTSSGERPVTGCGLGLDLSRLARTLAPTTAHRPVVAVIATGGSDLSRALEVARALHRSGIAAALATEGAAAGLAVVVRDGVLSARDAAGERTMRDLDEVVDLLIRHK